MVSPSSSIAIFPEGKWMYKECLYLLRGKSSDIAFCLKFKEWIDSCPSKCSYFVEDITGTIEEVMQEKYDVECEYCNRKPQLNGPPIFFCDLMQIETPFCDSCHFSSYCIHCPIYSRNQNPHDI